MPPISVTPAPVGAYKVTVEETRAMLYPREYTPSAPLLVPVFATVTVNVFASETVTVNDCAVATLVLRRIILSPVVKP
jgi:hypothetical protein